MFKKIIEVQSLRDNAKETNRFIIKERQFMPNGEFFIIVDRVTGVHYLQAGGSASAGGLTPLLDENGKVMIEKNI